MFVLTPVRLQIVASTLLKRVALSAVVCAGLLFLSAPVNAENQAVTPFERCDEFDVCPQAVPEAQIDSDLSVGKGTEENIFSFLDGTNQLVGQSIDGFARHVDEFLANEPLYFYSTGSYARVTLDHGWHQKAASGFLGAVRIKLDLPHTRKKYKFILESEPDKPRDELDTGVQTTPLDAAENRDYFAGLQLVSGSEDRWRRRIGIGVKVSYPLDSFVRLGARRTYPFELWSLNLDESFYWFDHQGQSFITSVELNRRMADNLLFRSTSRARWAEVNNYVETSQEFSFFQTLDQIRLVTFQAGVYGVTEPANMATDYRVSASFRQNLRKQYLFVELIPQLRYQKINGFVPERGIVLRLEWVFKG